MKTIKIGNNKNKITTQLLYINRLCNKNKWEPAKRLISQIKDFDMMTTNDLQLYYHIHRKIAFNA